MTHKHSIECEQHVSNKQAGGKSTPSKLDTPLGGTSTVAMGPDRAQVSASNHMQADTKVIMALSNTCSQDDQVVSDYYNVPMQPR